MDATNATHPAPSTRHRSLGYATDIRILEGFGAMVREEEACWAIQTPSNPSYYWGNFLLFRDAPGPGDFERWMACFDRAFADSPDVRHRIFAWDDPQGQQGDLGAFTAEGFEVERSVVLMSDQPVSPPHLCPNLVIRPLRTDDEWEAALWNQIACRADGFPEAPYEVFKRRQMRDYRALAETGAGNWFGAFLDDRLVGDLGVFVFGGVGRFQSVGTAPAFRRRGVCGTLVYQAARHAQAHLGAEQLVIVADPDDQAARLYQSVGFTPYQHQVAIVRRPV